jgi:hypothetical protein
MSGKMRWESVRLRSRGSLNIRHEEKQREHDAAARWLQRAQSRPRTSPTPSVTAKSSWPPLAPGEVPW